MAAQQMPDALDAAIDTLLSPPASDPGGTVAGAVPVALDAPLFHLMRRLRLLAVAASPRPEFLIELEAALVRGESYAKPRPVPVDANGQATGDRVLSRRRLLLAPAAAVALVALGTALRRSPVAQAQMARLASFVPGLGIRTYDTRGLVAPRPAAVTHGGATMTVKSLLSTGDATTVQVEVSGLPATPPLSSLLQESSIRSIVLTLRDASGTAYPLAPGAGGMLSGSGGASQSLRTEQTFVGLSSAVRLVEVSLTAPPPVGNWTVPVPVVPVAQSGLPAAQEQRGSITLHGITVSVGSVAADSQHTVVQLTGQAAPPIRFVRSLGRGGFSSQRALRDDHGRTYQEVRGPGRTFPDSGGHFTDDVQFPPLPANVRAATLTVPFVIVEETGEAMVQVPLVGRHVGDHLPVGAMLDFGTSPLRIAGAELVDQRGERRLLLHLEPGDWHDGRKLVHPGQLRIDGQGAAFQFSSDGDVGQATQLSVAVPAGAESVTLTLLYPNVAVQGPWQLPLTLPASR